MGKAVKRMEKGVRKSKTPGDRISIYLDAESLESFENIKRQWKTGNSETIQTILKMWQRMIDLLGNKHGLWELIANVLNPEEK